jgi:hypothetical protein
MHYHHKMLDEMAICIITIFNQCIVTIFNQCIVTILNQCIVTILNQCIVTILNQCILFLGIDKSSQELSFRGGQYPTESPWALPRCRANVKGSEVLKGAADKGHLEAMVIGYLMESPYALQ